MKKNPVLPEKLKDCLITAGILSVTSIICVILQQFSSADTHVPILFVLAVLCVSRFSDMYRNCTLWEYQHGGHDGSSAPCIHTSGVQHHEEILSCLTFEEYAHCGAVGCLFVVIFAFRIIDDEAK